MRWAELKMEEGKLMEYLFLGKIILDMSDNIVLLYIHNIPSYNHHHRHHRHVNAIQFFSLWASYTLSSHLISFSAPTFIATCAELVVEDTRMCHKKGEMCAGCEYVRMNSSCVILIPLWYMVMILILSIQPYHFGKTLWSIPRVSVVVGLCAHNTLTKKNSTKLYIFCPTFQDKNMIESSLLFMCHVSTISIITIIILDFFPTHDENENVSFFINAIGHFWK